jgi:hypothetical protein
MSLTSYLGKAARFQVDLDEAAAAVAPEVRAEFLRLLETPEDRVPSITLWFLEGGRAAAADELGSDEAADIIWDQIADLQGLSFSELSARNPDSRGDQWDRAAAVMVAAAQRQAVITKGPAIAAMAGGIAFGEVKARELGDVDPSTLDSRTFQINQAVANEKARRKAEAKNGSTQTNG